MPDVTIPIKQTKEGYETFIKCKSLPQYKVIGSNIITDNLSYNYVFGGESVKNVTHNPIGSEFDYQLYTLEKALEREKYAFFADCGIGKTVVEMCFAHTISEKCKTKALVLCPLAVMEDIQRECVRLYGYRMSNLRNETWKTDVALVNYEGRKEIDMRNVNCVVLDESSILKNGDGKIRKYLTEMTSNVRYRLACSATPSPNDQSEYGTHAVYLGMASTLKEYYSRYFRKDGTAWIMKKHAENAFYENLASWACYIHSPSILGFQTGAELNHEPNYIVQRSFCSQKYMPEGKLFSDTIDIKNANRVFTHLRSDIREDRFKIAVDSIQNKKCIIWCNRNAEESMFRARLKAKVVNGSTPIEKRVDIMDEFRYGDMQYLISKPSVLGFGVNLPEAEAHLFSGYNFSFEQFYQAVRRSHRYGRKGVLDVIVPVCEPEYPIWETLKRKLKTFKHDVVELQKRFFDEQNNNTTNDTNNN